MKINKKTKLGILFTLLIAAIIGAKYFYEICYKNYYLTIAGPINSRDGIGRQAIDMLKLFDSKVDMNLIYTYQSFTPDTVKKFVRNPNKKPGYVVLNEHTLFEINIPAKEYEEKYLMLHKHKKRNFFNRVPRTEQIFIDYSMFEADMLPQDVVYSLNKYWDMIVVPDQNLVEVYNKSGVTRPIFVLPLGVDLEEHLNAPLKNSKNKIFKFGNFSVFEERKNILLLVKAFHQAFKNNDQVRLILSPRGNYGGILEKVVDYILENNITNIEIDKLGSKEQDYFNFLLERIDCYVSPSKGEGFSIIPREVMARGIPMIVNDAAAQKTIADTKLVKVVHADKLVPGDYTFLTPPRIVGNFYDISVSDLADAMLDVYNNYQTYLDKAPEARNWAEKCQYLNMEEKYLNMVKPKKVILGDRNEITNDYLMTNSKDLYNKWKHLDDMGLLRK